MFGIDVLQDIAPSIYEFLPFINTPKYHNAAIQTNKPLVYDTHRCRYFNDFLRKRTQQFLVIVSWTKNAQPKQNVSHQFLALRVHVDLIVIFKSEQLLQLVNVYDSWQADFSQIGRLSVLDALNPSRDIQNVFL